MKKSWFFHNFMLYLQTIMQHKNETTIINKLCKLYNPLRTCPYQKPFISGRGAATYINILENFLFEYRKTITMKLNEKRVGIRTSILIKSVIDKYRLKKYDQYSTTISLSFDQWCLHLKYWKIRKNIFF